MNMTEGNKMEETIERLRNYLEFIINEDKWSKKKLTHLDLFNKGVSYLKYHTDFKLEEIEDHVNRALLQLNVRPTN